MAYASGLLAGTTWEMCYVVWEATRLGGGAMISAWKFSVETPKKRDHLKDVGVHERMVLKLIVNINKPKFYSGRN